jgi:hypothetical protein
MMKMKNDTKIQDELAYRLKEKTDCTHCGAEKFFELDGEYVTSQGVLCKIHWLRLLVKNAQDNTNLEDELAVKISVKARCILCDEYCAVMEEPNDKGEYITSRGVMCKYHWNKEFTGRCVAND